MRKRYPLLALAVVLIGCDDDDSVSPPPAETSQVLTFADETPVGTSSLERTANGIEFSVETTELPENPVSLWIVVFNHPENCGSSPCSESDLLENPDVMPDLLNGFAGQIVGNGGNAKFMGARNAGDAEGSVLGALGAPAPGIMDPETAEIHLVLRSHGPAIAGMEDEMAQSFNAGCEHPGEPFPNPLPESLGAPGENTCGDMQFAVHQPQP